MQVPSFQTCQSQSKRDLIIIRAVYGLISESEEWNYSTGSTVKCFNSADKKNKKIKKSEKTVTSKNKNNWITSYAHWSLVIKTVHEFPNERPASGEDIQKRREEEERKKHFVFYQIKGKQC